MTNTNNQTITFLTHVGEPGGAEYVMMRLCNSVKDQCNVVHFQEGPLEQHLNNRGIASYVLPMPQAMANTRREGGIMSIIRVVPNVISMIVGLHHKTKDSDVIVAMSQKSFVLAALAKPLTRKPIIWFMNDLVSPDHFSKPLIFAMTKIFALFADKIVLNSQASFDAWKMSGGATDKCLIIYPGTDENFIDAHLQKTDVIEKYRDLFGANDAPVIGIFGRISHWKGQDVFLKALAQIPNARGVIVGEAYFGEDLLMGSLQNFIAEHNMQDRIIFTGQLHDVPCAMAACDVVVHASTHPEPFWLVIVEALMCNKPVVASNAGGATEIILNGETGYLTTPNDADALADAIKDLLDNKDRAEKFAIKGRARAIDKFSNITMITDFKALISHLV